MDKPIAKKPVYYRYRWHIAGGIAFIVLLIYVGIAASADACGYDDFTHKLGPEVGALGVLTALAVLNIGPFGMSGHFV